ncbi:MAG: hypothetical protein GY862_29190 [Gammaproteobacteria bacterium]|nr:hypothetical protein [Gammaproteobacteria bacterium]
MADFCVRDNTVETQLIMDETRDHYQLVQMGWQGNIEYTAVCCIWI